jgi:hypothetical protein
LGCLLYRPIQVGKTSPPLIPPPPRQRILALHPVKGAFVFVAQSHAQEASPFRISGNPDTVPTSTGGHILASRNSNVRITGIFPSPHEEPLKVLMPTPVSVVVSIDMDLCPANNAGVVMPHDPQDRNSQTFERSLIRTHSGASAPALPWPRAGNSATQLSHHVFNSIKSSTSPRYKCQCDGTM